MLIDQGSGKAPQLAEGVRPQPANEKPDTGTAPLP